MQFSTAFEEDVISACATHDRNNRQAVAYHCCLVVRGFFVKYGDYSSIYPGYLTQIHLADAAKAVPEVHVPEVHHFFYRDKGMAYVVMENIQLIEVSTEELVQKTAQAVTWMRSVKAPNEVVLGPLGSGRAYHVLFKDREAPLDFTGVKAVERFFNTAVACVRRYSRRPIEDISFAGEQLVLTQSDMNRGNFGVDRERRLCIFDFTEIGWLWESLADYTLLLTTEFAAAVAKALDARRSPNLDSKGRVRYLLAMSASSSLEGPQARRPVGHQGKIGYLQAAITTYKPRANDERLQRGAPCTDEGSKLARPYMTDSGQH
ncbi:hypothetical protein FRC00_000915 [Tulasnella sp. 408]|nr:hypothetical protein FRC00_000915 [Tulasnella sp. 408]